ncbi:globin family protein [Bradyrhizobium neotropicale]|uniref:Hemin receptor n=1 Tax=Bradyrhizobium neotropicale TaxID=1497615 RepID=A0A176YW00_9BRAD|nr:globin family protein [Bradyrhizobium neotropicale]OAF11566.1 hemin receptor [Bradyrhizobium neotropicale]
MNEQTISLVQESFKKLAPKADEVGMMFYDRLFEIYPEVRPMFARDIGPQSRKLVQMLALVVNGLRNLDSILPAVKELAQRHHGYGVVDAHYQAVGSTLIWTLRRSLGEAFTTEVERAWHDAFETLSTVMIEASRERRPA